jgi:hypothetical protein
MNARNLDRFESGATGPWWLITLRRLAWPTGVLLPVLLVMLLLLGPLKQIGSEPAAGGIASLAELEPPERAFEGRLTHFPYRPRERVVDGKRRREMAYLVNQEMSALIVRIA